MAHARLAGSSEAKSRKLLTSDGMVLATPVPSAPQHALMAITLATLTSLTPSQTLSNSYNRAALEGRRPSATLRCQSCRGFPDLAADVQENVLTAFE